MLAVEEPIDRSPLMKVARTAAEVLSEHVSLTLECLDQMYLNVYVPVLQRGAGAAWFLRDVRGAGGRGRARGRRQAPVSGACSRFLTLALPTVLTV